MQTIHPGNYQIGKLSSCQGNSHAVPNLQHCLRGSVAVFRKPGDLPFRKWNLWSQKVFARGALMCRNWPMMAQWTIGWAGGAWGQWGLRNRHSLAWTLHLAIWGAHTIWQIANIMSQITGSKDLGYDTDCTRVDFFSINSKITISGFTISYLFTSQLI